MPYPLTGRFLIYINCVHRYTDCYRDECFSLISTRSCIRIARPGILSPPCLTSCCLFREPLFWGPFRRRTPRGFALREVSCWTYFLPGFCRAVPVISTPALLSLGRSKRTRLCCYPILWRGVFLMYMNCVHKYTDVCRDGCLGLILTRACTQIVS